jgi:hypothetical protein
VATQALTHSEFESSQSLLRRDILPGHSFAPSQPVVHVNVHFAGFLALDPGVAGRQANKEARCVKGLIVGLGLEGVMALGMFGIWQLWHLIR